MLIDFLRRSNKTLAAVLLGASTFLLQSCGGGGTSSDTGLIVGPLSILPNSGTIYAGVPTTFTIAGGRSPYIIASSEPTVMPVPSTVSGNTMTLVPNNPGVVDPNTDPNTVPSRSVIITVRDSSGTQVTATYNVLQNFLTGYNISISSLATCGVTGTTAPAACAGFESRIDVRPTSNGLLRAQRQLRFSVLYGPIAFIQDDNVTLASTYLLTTDSTGNGRARFVPTAGSPTQFVAIRITDVQTGAYLDVPFTLLSAPTATLTALPSTIPTLTGATSAQCGSGVSSIVITGGRPPYTATATTPSIQVVPSTVPNSGDSFTVNISGGIPPNCTTGQVVITDSLGTTISVGVTTAPGTTAPVQPLSVAPSSFCFTTAGGAQSGVINVTGGGASKVLNTNNAAIATVSPTSSTTTPFTATISSPGAAPNGTAIISVTDGASTVNVTVNRQVACP